MKIDGFGIAGYRSFGEDLVKIPDLTKVNVFIGKNNSGKSNILRFCKHLSLFKTTGGYDNFIMDIDFCRNMNPPSINYSFQIKEGPSATAPIFKEFKDLFEISGDKFHDWNESLWIDFTSTGSRTEHSSYKKIITYLEENFNLSQIIVWAKELGFAAQDKKKCCDFIADRILRKVQWKFEVHEIDAFRKIGPAETQSNFNGTGLIKKLRQFQSPRLLSRPPALKKFKAIKEFLQELLGEPDAFIEIPAEEDVINVSIRGKMLPLESLGTGIHELVILASAVTIVDDVVFCIEEPEIHLHPELQKKFVRYILEKTNNQYLIATHSNAFFDIDDVNVYHCQLVDGHTQCDLVTTHIQKSAVLSDLGYKASDLLQANYVIWVEGPSDRIYLSRWLKDKCPEFIEGLHYSIMFYGGRLLSHLAFNDPELDDFIQLCRLNRNACILIDSDKEKPRTSLNKTKKRVIKDFESNGAITWVTNGRTIENYIPKDAYNQAIKKVHTETWKKFKWERYADLAKLRKDKTIDKVAVAKKIVSVDQDYSILDLEQQLRKLIKDIQKANA